MNIGSICTRRMIAVDSSSTLAQAAGLMIRSGIEREVAESRGDPQPPKPMPLRVPAVGTAGWTA